MNTESYVDLDTNTATSTTSLSKTSASTSDLLERPVWQPNRQARRKKIKMRSTKKVKYIRKKVIVGDVDVTTHSKYKLSAVEMYNKLWYDTLEYIKKSVK